MNDQQPVAESMCWLTDVVVNVVLFTLRSRDLQVCLVQRLGSAGEISWSLPGGQIGVEESLDNAAIRHLRDQTGVEGVYLQQLYTFGAPQRDPNQRVVCVAYFALVAADRLMPEKQSACSANPTWHSMYRLPPLVLDHAAILEYALTRLRYKIEYSAVAFELMPEEFTLRELQDAYMVILNDQKLDKANFRKKIREAHIVEPINSYRATGGRPARLYRFRADVQLETKARRIFP